MKYHIVFGNNYLVQKSHPARGAWIEIGETGKHAKAIEGRTPQGVRGLKFQILQLHIVDPDSRTPQGVRVN